MPEAKSRFLFDFLRLVAVAAARKKLNAREAAVATWVALGSNGTTGENAHLDAAGLALEFGISERTAQRLFYGLVDAGWFEKTADPRRGSPGVPGSGRRARYRLCLPNVSLGLLDDASESYALLSRHTEPYGTTAESADLAHQEAPDALWDDRTPTHGTTEPDPWDDTTTPTGGARTPSVGTPTNSSPRMHVSASTTDRASSDRVMHADQIDPSTGAA